MLANTHAHEIQLEFSLFFHQLLCFSTTLACPRVSLFLSPCLPLLPSQLPLLRATSIPASRLGYLLSFASNIVLTLARAMLSAGRGERRGARTA